MDQLLSHLPYQHIETFYDFVLQTYKFGHLTPVATE